MFNNFLKVKKYLINNPAAGNGELNPITIKLDTSIRYE